MARKFGKKNQVKVDPFNYSLMMLGEPKIGKTSLLYEVAEKLVGEVDLVLGVGSGVINDLCKIVSFESNIPYYIVATAPSMDGYASGGSALILKGMKVTINVRPPKAIIGDTDVLKNAPQKMLQAGYGDIIGKYQLPYKSMSICLSEDNRYLYVCNSQPDVAIERFKVEDILNAE